MRLGLDSLWQRDKLTSDFVDMYVQSPGSAPQEALPDEQKLWEELYTLQQQFRDLNVSAHGRKLTRNEKVTYDNLLTNMKDTASKIPQESKRKFLGR